MKFYFDDNLLDSDRHELYRSGELIRVEPKVFSLLCYLAENPQRLISTDELLQSVWKGRVVSDTTVAGCVKHARNAIGDDGHRQALIKTIRGRGIRLRVDVSSVQEPKQAVGMTQPAEPAADVSSPVDGVGTAISFNPSLAIQKFQSYSEKTGMRPFVHGLSIALTNVLSRIPLLRLCPLLTDGNPLAPRQVHEAMGADYCLSGSAEIATDHLRIMVQLCDARTGFNLWTHQFQIPGTLDSAHDLTVLAIVSRLEPQLHRAMYNSARLSARLPSALELYLQASGLLALKGWHHDSFEKASGLLRQSWQQAPEFAHASSYLSLVLGLGQRLGLMSNETHVRQEALEAAERSLELETMDSAVMGLAGCALGDLGQGERALSILKRAVDLNPNNGQAWSALGSVELSQRRVQDAITHLNHGIELSPHDSRLSVWGGVLATAHRVRGDLDEAVASAKLACERDDRTYMPRVILAGVYLTAGDKLQASAALADAFRAKPDLSDAQIAYLVGKRLARELAPLCSVSKG